MKNVGIIGGSVVGAIIVGIGVGIGAIKLYQTIGPVQKDKTASQTATVAPVVDPVKKVRATCSQVGAKAPASVMYGDVNRQAAGETRQSTTFTAIARVMQTNPVVLDIDVASVKPATSFLFDESMHKLPTYQLVVTDSAVHGLHINDVIKASIEFSRPKVGEGLVDPTPEELATVVKLQNSLAITDTAKQGLFAKDFTLFALPSMSSIYMASGTRYSYTFTTETSSGISDIKQMPPDGMVNILAARLAELDVYSLPSAKDATTNQATPVYCGYADASGQPLSNHDQEIFNTPPSAEETEELQQK